MHPTPKLRGPESPPSRSADRCHRWGAAFLAAVLATTLLGQSPRINELQSANDTTLEDEDGEASDWIELYNPGLSPFDLSGCGLSDNPSNPFKWVFGPGSTLNPTGYLVVFASGKDRQPELAPSLAPLIVPGLKTWLRADAVDVTNAAQIRRLGTLAFLRQWRDLSGNNNHATQTTDSLQPLWISNGSAGLPCVRFDGLNDLLRLTRPLATNNFCIFAVCRTAQAHETDPESTVGVGGVSGQRWLFGAQHGGDLDAGSGVSIGTNGVAAYEHGANYMPALLAYPHVLGNGILVLAINYSNRQPALDRQGLSVRTGRVSPRRDVWAPVEIGSGAYGAFSGDVLEILIFNRSLTLDERRGLARTLADRYAVPLALPKHTNFRLDAAGESVVLTRSNGTPIDTIDFGPTPRDASYGRANADPNEWLFFSTPTPGVTNAPLGSPEWLDPPAVSHGGGFHAGPFDLTLASPIRGAQVRYTLDGSDPTEASPLYTIPIPIRSRTGTPNDLSAIPTVPGGLPPTNEVFKGTVVRARAFKTNALPSPAVTRTFFIHAQGRARYSLPVVALSVSRQDFFDPATGIYVPGNAPGGNYSQRGPEWERPVHVEFYETDNRLVLDQDGDVKIHGNTSQNFPIKGLDLDATGGAGHQPFRHRIFPDRSRAEFEHVLLRPSGHDHSMAFMRDELMQSLGAETGAEFQAARPCVVFLNGEYWGLHYLKEKEDTDFVANYGDVPADSLDYLEGYAAAKAGDTVHYDALMAFVAANDLAAPAHFTTVQTLMDVPNYIDYKVAEVFNYRWDIGNHRLWRPRTPEGRWRWLQFDNDVGWGGFWAEQPAVAYDMLAADLSTDGRLHDHNNETTTFLLRHLIANATFRRDFGNRFADLLNSSFHPTNTLARINSLAAPLEPEMAEHTRRWRAPASLEAWQSAVAYLRDYAARRPDFCRQHLASKFALPGTVRITVSIIGTGDDAVRLSTLRVLDPDGSGWRGTYFRGLDLPLRPEPAPGHRFVRWVGPVRSVAPDSSISPTADLTVGAVFAADTLEAPRIVSMRLSPDNTVEIHCATRSLETVGLESSDGLDRWTSEAWLVTDLEGRGLFTCSVPPAARARFFRLRLP
jgi:hypothetical protein